MEPKIEINNTNMIIFPYNNNNINKIQIQNKILIQNHAQNQTQIKPKHKIIDRNLKEEKEIFEINFYICTFEKS